MRLSAIVFTDIVGFSKLTEGDEVTGLELLATLKRMANKPERPPGADEHGIGLRHAGRRGAGRHEEATGDRPVSKP